MKKRTNRLFTGQNKENNDNKRKNLLGKNETIGLQKK